MSLFDCVNDAMDEGSMTKEFGKKAQQAFRLYSQRLQSEGKPKHVAEQMASDRVKKELAAEAAAKRHTELAKLSFMQDATFRVNMQQGKKPRMTEEMELVDFRYRGIMRAANGRMAQYIAAVKPDLLSRRDVVVEEDMLRAVIDNTAKTPEAKAMADGVSDALEWLRLMANELGANIGKLDRYFPVSHNRRSILAAGEADWVKANPGQRAADNRPAVIEAAFTRWYGEIEPKLDWQSMRQPGNGLPFPPQPTEIDRRTFLRAAFDNIVFSREAEAPVYGRSSGEAPYRRMSQERVLHWKSADEWITYNTQYGSGTPTAALQHHLNTMARDIALMQRFGPSPRLGLDYTRQLWMTKGRNFSDDQLQKRAAANYEQAQRMMNVLNGPGIPNTRWEEWSQAFFATTRSVLRATLLDRAVLMAPPDIASAQMAAKMIGAKPDNIISQYTTMAQSLSRDELLQLDWVAETWADPGVSRSMFEAEPGTQPWAQVMSNASMRVQGLALHTDWLRGISYQAFAGQVANEAGKPFAQLHFGLQTLLSDAGVTPGMWDAFRADGMFKAPNGSKFLMPIYWRRNTSLTGREADEIFIAMQGAAERYLELSVPSRSLFVEGWLAPEAYGFTPGNPIYEFMKSGLMFKSFIGAATRNMMYQWKARPEKYSRAAYLAEHMARATILAAFALQVKQILAGNDPQDMNPMTNPDFWFRALAAGGGLALAGDLLILGSNPNGQTLQDYVTGPVIAAGMDTIALTTGNITEAASQAMAGEPIDMNLVPELRRFTDRYLVPDPPFLGPALDRMVFDQLQIMLDPESRDSLARAATQAEARYGNAAWFMPGQALPERGPNMLAAIGMQ